MWFSIVAKMTFKPRQCVGGSNKMPIRYRLAVSAQSIRNSQLFGIDLRGRLGKLRLTSNSLGWEFIITRVRFEETARRWASRIVRNAKSFLDIWSHRACMFW